MTPVPGAVETSMFPPDDTGEPPPWPDGWALCKAVYPEPGPVAWARRLRLAWLMWRHGQVHQALRKGMAGLGLSTVARAMPRLFRKVYHPYPCTGLDIAQRADHLITHHALAVQCLGGAQFCDTCLGHETPLCEVPLPRGGGLLPVRLRALSRFEWEGDLSLALYDPFGTLLYTLTFSFERLPDGQPALFIGALHGTLPVSTARHLTKLCHGLRPQNLMVWLLQQFAAQWGVRSIRAVSRARHACAGTSRERGLHFDYDGFWRSLGGQPAADGCFDLPLQALRRTPSEVPAHKRTLYQRRYAWLDGVAARLANAPRLTPPAPPAEAPLPLPRAA